MTHKIQIDAAPLLVGSRYPHPYDVPCQRIARDALVLEVGTRGASPATGLVDYPNIDMQLCEGRLVHRDGRPYPPQQQPPTPGPSTRR